MLNAIRDECSARQKIAEHHLAQYGMLGHPESFHLWLPMVEGWSPVELATYLRGQGVGVVASAAFSTDGDPPDAVRICLGGPTTRDECEHGMHLVADTLQHPVHHHATNL
jgi:DNA-binding transcriptional MocR family regulator